MLSIFLAFCPDFFLMCMWLFKHKRGPFFGLNHRVTQVDRTYYWSERVVPRRKACHRSMVSFHVVTEKSNHQPTNQPTTTTKNTRHLSNNNNQTSAHIFYPKPSFILELVVVVIRSFFIYLLFFVVVVLVILSKQTPRGFLLSESTRRTKRNPQRMVDGET